ncbi:HPr family phosphocarrier protein [Sphaerochaeta sp. PS]|uniref:HPr family phosphocarrier protein n=1 Tax=Sphaerochaeta sp. PS TaxID=3076336 RepID=UPI0028A362ED|nr:HPr family phosphocarrier protein [Sphaerochaeta sp. PS]MDT4761866.1 HPr family phosphocarrier protein [Sphaerochaeta sp. PS]
MVTREIKVCNRAGIHARPAANIVKVANKFKSELFLEKGTMKINGKSIMGIITLGATYQSTLTMICTGPDEEEMAEAIDTLFKNRFEE